MKTSPLRSSFLLLFAALGASCGFAYAPTSSHWTAGKITLTLELGSPDHVLTDGTSSWNDVALDAIAGWNKYLDGVTLVGSKSPVLPLLGNNGVNDVIWATTIYGQEFGNGVVATTLVSSNGSKTTETDVIFNSAYHWDSYRGPTVGQSGTPSVVMDLRRVALHEFGHVLGLTHPDQAGQDVVAMMNCRIVGGLDHLATDDIDGIQSIYGGRNDAAPHITSHPYSSCSLEGSSVLMSVSATNATSYQWLKDGQPIAGATNCNLLMKSLSSTDGAYSAIVSNSNASVESEKGYLMTEAVPPYISSQPQSQTAVIGGTVTLSVNAVDGATYQWKKDGVAVAGATSPTLSIAGTTQADAGSYTVTVSNSAGTITSTAAAVTEAPPSRLVNCSVRSKAGNGDDVLVAGFVISGAAPKTVLIRAVGPTLSQFGVPCLCSTPNLSVYSGQSVVAANSHWQNTADLAAATAKVGAFALAPDSADAALVVALSPGNYSAVVSSGGAEAGTVLVEIYEVQ